MSMTINQPSVVDEGEFSVRRTIQIDATIEKVWAAVTVPAHISQWFGRAVLEGSGVGSRGTLTWEGRDPVPLRIEEIDAPRMISYRWSNNDVLTQLPERVAEEHSTVFTFTLETIADGTRLTVVETGFENTSDPIANLESHRDGWNVELDKLVGLLETSA